MGKLPVCSGREAVAAFQRLGWTMARQSGSHMILVRAGMSVTLSVPAHRELDRGTLRALVRLAGATVDEFVDALDA